MNAIIVGVGGHARVVIDILRQAGVTVVGIITDIQISEGTIEGIPVVCGFEELAEYIGKKDVDGAICAVGDNNKRAEYYEKFCEMKIPMINAIHPRTVISSNVVIGKGVVIAAGAVICTGSVIKDNVIINTSASVDHDCMIGNHSHLSPGSHIAGRVSIGSRSWIGIGASIIDKISIGNNVIIGAGSTVISDMPDNVVAVGVPARIIKSDMHE